MEEQQALKNCLLEFQKARRKLLENAAALAAKGMDASNSSMNKTKASCSDRSGAYLTAKMQQSSVSSTVYDDPQGYIPPVCNNGSCGSPVRIL